MTYSIEKHFLAFMTFLPIILLEYQTALQKFGKISIQTAGYTGSKPTEPTHLHVGGGLLVAACLNIYSRLREHPLERVWHQKGQRKSPLSLQGLKVSFLRLQSSHYFIQMNTLKQQGGSNVFFLVPYPLQGGARAGESQEQSTRTLIVCLSNRTI